MTAWTRVAVLVRSDSRCVLIVEPVRFVDAFDVTNERKRLY